MNEQERLNELQEYCRYLYEIKNCIMFLLTHRDMTFPVKNYFINIYNSILDDIDQNKLECDELLNIPNKKQKNK